jgi:hypothetical protein
MGAISRVNDILDKPIPPGKVLVILLMMDIGVGTLHLIFSSDPEMGAFFNLANEANLPTWYSSFQFLLVSSAGCFCYTVEKSKNLENSGSWGWLIVALCMLGLAIDETFQIHEALINQIMSGNTGNNIRHFFGVTRYTDSLLWTVIFAPAMILAGTGLIMFYFSRLRSNKILFRLSMLPISLLALSAVLEFLEAKVLSSIADDSLIRYRQLIFIEEMAELLAASIFVWIHYQYGIWWSTTKDNLQRE